MLNKGTKNIFFSFAFFSFVIVVNRLTFHFVAVYIPPYVQTHIHSRSTIFWAFVYSFNNNKFNNKHLQKVKNFFFNKKKIPTKKQWTEEEREKERKRKRIFVDFFVIKYTFFNFFDSHFPRTLCVECLHWKKLYFLISLVFFQSTVKYGKVDEKTIE